MTPKFYSVFDIFQKTLNIFNKKCDCKGVSAIILFEQSLGTKNDDNDYNQWIARFSSDAFGFQRFGGTKDRVSELITIFIEQIISQTLEACFANKDEWYKDKPEVESELYALHSEFIKLKDSV